MVALGTALVTLSALLLANPIVLIVAALVGAAALIYLNWDGIVQFFKDTWDGIKAAVGFKELVADVEGWGVKFYTSLTSWWSGIATFFRREWEKVKAAVDFEWINRVAGFVSGIFGGGDEPGVAASSNVVSIGPPPRGSANIVVDFRNMPRGTSVESRADSDTDLEVTTGFSMQGAQ